MKHALSDLDSTTQPLLDVLCLNLVGRSKFSLRSLTLAVMNDLTVGGIYIFKGDLLLRYTVYIYCVLYLGFVP